MKLSGKKNLIQKITAIALAFCIVSVSALAMTMYRKKVVVTDGEITKELSTYSRHTADILSKAEINLEREDEIVRKETDETIHIEVLRAFDVDIIYHEEPYTVSLASGTVEDALDKANLTLCDDDMLNVSTDKELSEDTRITVKLVKFIEKTEIQTVDFEREFESSADYPLGFEQTLTKGRKGERAVTTTYRYVDGKRVGKPSVTTKITKEPVNSLTLCGTADTVQTAAFSNENTQNVSQGGIIPATNLAYSKVLSGSATAYTAQSGALTATGVAAYVGGVAVNPDIIPYGSKLYIETVDGFVYGYATAVDTGSALKSGEALVDLYFSTYEECINFGRRDAKVYILK